ncbi:RNA-binding protein 12-like [Sesbania bispinosa]|nr:RNA-binding protein 12-like [Sesbania bispinosa]
MASYSYIILAFYIVVSFSSMNIGIEARHLLQTTPSGTSLPKPTLPQGSVPTLPTLPSLPTIPTVTLPPLPVTNSLPNFPSIPTIPTTFPSIPFLSPPPSTTSP